MKTLSLRWFIIAGWATGVMVGVEFLGNFWLIFGLSKFAATHWCDSLSRPIRANGLPKANSLSQASPAILLQRAAESA